MKIGDIKKFLDYLKLYEVNKFYISQPFYEWAHKEFGYSELTALDIFDQNIKKITDQIKLHLKKCEEENLIPEFFFDEYDDEILIKQIFKYDKIDQKTIITKLEYRKQFQELLKLLDWRELEKLSKIILSENHIKNIKVTQSTNDQGIDFYGFYKFESEKLLPRFYKYLNFRIIGQVKHSTKNVAVDHQKVASFATEIRKLRKDNNSEYFQSIDEDFLKSDIPIVGIFITNSHYPKKAIDFAKEYSIIYWNGEQISEDLCNDKFINSIKDQNNILNLELFKSQIEKVI